MLHLNFQRVVHRNTRKRISDETTVDSVSEMGIILASSPCQWCPYHAHFSRNWICSSLGSYPSNFLISSIFSTLIRSFCEYAGITMVLTAQLDRKLSSRTINTLTSLNQNKTFSMKCRKNLFRKDELRLRNFVALMTWLLVFPSSNQWKEPSHSLWLSTAVAPRICSRALSNLAHLLKVKYVVVVCYFI